MTSELRLSDSQITLIFIFGTYACIAAPTLLDSLSVQWNVWMRYRRKSRIFLQDSSKDLAAATGSTNLHNEDSILHEAVKSAALKRAETYKKKWYKKSASSIPNLATGLKSNEVSKNSYKKGSFKLSPQPVDTTRPSRESAKDAALKRLGNSKKVHKGLSSYKKKEGTANSSSHEYYGRGVVTDEQKTARKYLDCNKNDLASIVELNKQIESKKLQRAEGSQRNHNSQTPEERASVLADRSLVYTDGVTVFRIIPTLPFPDLTTHILSKIANEFLPIIYQRGYRVRSVSEYYTENGRMADSDGLDYELGGFSRSAQPGDKIQGHELRHTRGYNSIVSSGTPFGSRSLIRLKPDHTIHLRLRHPDNVNTFYSYDQVVRTMAHELAHCVHRNHSDSFNELEEDIMEEYRAINEEACG